MTTTPEQAAGEEATVADGVGVERVGGAPAAPPLRVVVADDSAVIRQLISVNLELEGFAVSTAADGLQALELVGQVQPHVVTLDVMMPRLNGFEVVERLHADPRTSHVPVVIVSGRARPDDLARGERLGVDAYLIKPFEPAELVDVVARLARSGRK